MKKYQRLMPIFWLIMLCACLMPAFAAPAGFLPGTDVSISFDHRLYPYSTQDVVARVLVSVSGVQEACTVKIYDNNSAQVTVYCNGAWVQEIPFTGSGLKEVSLILPHTPGVYTYTALGYLNGSVFGGGADTIKVVKVIYIQLQVDIPLGSTVDTTVTLIPPLTPDELKMINFESEDTKIAYIIPGNIFAGDPGGGNTSAASVSAAAAGMGTSQAQYGVATVPVSSDGENGITGETVGHAYIGGFPQFQIQAQKPNYNVKDVLPKIKYSETAPENGFTPTDKEDRMDPYHPWLIVPLEQANSANVSITPKDKYKNVNFSIGNDKIILNHETAPSADFSLTVTPKPEPDGYKMKGNYFDHHELIATAQEPNLLNICIRKQLQLRLHIYLVGDRVRKTTCTEAKAREVVKLANAIFNQQVNIYIPDTNVQVEERIIDKFMGDSVNVNSEWGDKPDDQETLYFIASKDLENHIVPIFIVWKLEDIADPLTQGLYCDRVIYLDDDTISPEHDKGYVKDTLAHEIFHIWVAGHEENDKKRLMYKVGRPSRVGDKILHREADLVYRDVL